LTPIIPILQSTTQSLKIEPVDISSSSALTLALQQMYNGLSESFFSHTSETSSTSITKQLFFIKLQNAILCFQNNVQHILTTESMDHRELLHFAQVNDSTLSLSLSLALSLSRSLSLSLSLSL
jgi:hypothetical protein